MKDLRFSQLLDAYEGLLTPKQREVMRTYYDEDLSLGEIAEGHSISRQGVRNFIKRSEERLLEAEQNLGFSSKTQKFATNLEKILQLTKELEAKCCCNENVSKIIQNIKEIAENSKDFSK